MVPIEGFERAMKIRKQLKALIPRVVHQSQTLISIVVCSLAIE